VADEPIIAISGLRFTYAGSDRPALDGIDLQVMRGEFVGVMGSNGAGKTTLGLSLNGIVPHMLIGDGAGSIRVGGLDPTIAPVREMARTVGIVFDNPEFQMSQVTAADEVALGLENLGVPSTEMPGRIADALRIVGLAGVEDRSPMALSGGEQQRLAIASVLAMRPAILFMDEPTSNLDPRGKAEIFEIARRLNREEGMTVIVAEHDVEALAEFADRIVVLSEGRIALDGPPAEVLGRVEALEAIGLRSPQVTEFAHAVSGASAGLPVTVDATLAWLAARR
jgi:energy-coupling factor transport system ATP-binding protein